MLLDRAIRLEAAKPYVASDEIDDGFANLDGIQKSNSGTLSRANKVRNSHQL